MRTGLKVGIKKIVDIFKKPITARMLWWATTLFPKTAVPLWQIRSRLFITLQELSKSDISHNIGQLYTRPNKLALETYSNFLPYNPNNIGNWSSTAAEDGTRRLEFELINKLVGLYNAQPSDVEGYATSGGTEGNLYSVWVSKTLLLNSVTLNQICLFKSKLAHYSIDKSCHLCSIDYLDVPLDPETWSMDPMALKLQLIEQIKKGKKGFIISLTIGYTETGTADNLEAINTVVEEIKKEHAGVVASIIVDAAFDGLIKPFILNNFSPFLYKNVQAFATDFSKFTAVPYPAGVVLYRKKLRKLIEKSVPVFAMKDNTIAGSRSGASVAAMWAVIHLHGRDQFKSVIQKQLQLKTFFINKMLQLFPKAEVITTPESLTCGFIFSTKTGIKLPTWIEEKYWLYSKMTTFEFSNNTKRRVLLYKFFFLPHLKKRAVDDFFNDLRMD